MLDMVLTIHPMGLIIFCDLHQLLFYEASMHTLFARFVNVTSPTLTLYNESA
jgi:hypothetical protein